MVHRPLMGWYTRKVLGRLLFTVPIVTAPVALSQGGSKQGLPMPSLSRIYPEIQ